MPIYAIGDLQGCYTDLQRLLQHIHFNAETDMLWFAGDLVNRGPDSLSSLRFVKSLGDSAISVLGNHDLHLLAVAEGIKAAKNKDIAAIIAAPDCDELLHWLRQRPLLHHDQQHTLTMVHAGIYPLWSLQQAQTHAQELEAMLRSERYHEFLHVMYGNKPAIWNNDLTGMDRLRFICNSFTRMRYCNPKGRLDMADKGAPGSQREGYLPWFEHPQRKTRQDPIVFGHWSTLGQVDVEHIYPLDTGCVWGGQLTALRIDRKPMQYFSIDCPGTKRPGKT